MATLKRRGGASFHTAKKYFINKGRKFATVLDTPTFMGTRIQAKNLIDISERCRSFAQLSKSIPKTCIQKKECKQQIAYLSADVESIKDFVNSYPNKKDWEDIKTTDDMSKDEAVFLFRLELLSKRLQDYAHPPPTDTPTVYKDVYYVSELYKRTHPEYDSTGIPPDIKDVVAKEMNPGLETTLKKDETAAAEKDNNLQELTKKFYDIERTQYPAFLKQLESLKNEMDSAYWFNEAVKKKKIGDKIIKNESTLVDGILKMSRTFKEENEVYDDTKLREAKSKSERDYNEKKKAYDEKNKEDPRRVVINEEIIKVKESLKNAEIKFNTYKDNKSKTEVVDLQKYLSKISEITPNFYKTILEYNLKRLKTPKYGGTSQSDPILTSIVAIKARVKEAAEVAEKSASELKSLSSKEDKIAKIEELISTANAAVQAAKTLAEEANGMKIEGEDERSKALKEFIGVINAYAESTNASLVNLTKYEVEKNDEAFATALASSEEAKQKIKDAVTKIDSFSDGDTESESVAGVQSGPGTAQSGPEDSTYKPSPMIQAYGPKIFELWKIELKEMERTFYQEYRAQFINGPLKALEAYDKSNDIAESDLNKLITKNGPAESGSGSNSSSSSGSSSGSSSSSSSGSFNEEESKEHLEKLKSVNEIIVTSKKNKNINFILRKKNTGTKKIYEIEVAGAPGSNTVTQTVNKNMTLRNRGNVKGPKPGTNLEGVVVGKQGNSPEGLKPGTNLEGPKQGTKPEGPKQGTNLEGPNSGNNPEAITTARANVEALKNAIGILMDNIEASDKEKIVQQLPIVTAAIPLTESSKTALATFTEADATNIKSEIDNLTTLAKDTTKEATDLITALGTADQTAIDAAKEKAKKTIADTLRARLKK